MTSLLRQIWLDESGQDAAEYALLLVLIAVTLVTAVSSFRTAIENGFGRATNILDPAPAK